MRRENGRQQSTKRGSHVSWCEVLILFEIERKVSKNQHDSSYALDEISACWIGSAVYGQGQIKRGC